MHESQKCYAELTELTVGDIWQIADADQELRRLIHSSQQGTLKLYAKYNNRLPQQACKELAEEKPASTGRQASAETDHVHISQSL